VTPTVRSGERLQASPIWWLSPAGAVALIVPGTLWLAWRLSDQQYRDFYRTPKVLTADVATMLVAGALAFVLGALVVRLGGMRRTARAPMLTLNDAQWSTLRRAERVLFALTTVGYAAWVVSAIRHGLTPGALVGAILHPSSETVEYLFVTVPGITTLTQFGIAYVVVATLLLLHRRAPKIGRRLGLVLLLTALRALLITERLALIEMALPVAVVVAAHFSTRGTRASRTLIAVAPVALIASLALVFGIFEHSRSWTFFQVRTQQSYVEFTLTRLAGYYVTSYNNSAIAWDFQRYPGRIPYGTITGLWEAPVVSQLGLYDKLTPASGSVPAGEEPLEKSLQLLDLHGNPEYNNPGGLGAPFIDYGVAGGVLFLLLAGAVLGFAHGSFLAGGPTAVLTYPVLANGLFDLPRYLYWPQGRATPALLAALLVGYALHRRAGRAA
jgi:hypothetical protein